MTTWLFKTPTVAEGPSGTGSRLFQFYKIDVGITIVKDQGEYYQARYLVDSDLASYEEVYRGGGNHTVDDATKAALIASDIDVTEANFTEVQV
jgi:hypothetical protein